jgi:hypothetical protein
MGLTRVMHDAITDALPPAAQKFDYKFMGLAVIDLLYPTAESRGN